METVTEQLLHEERKLADGESSYRNDGEKVMAARSQKSWAPKCYKLGHIKRDYPERDSQKDTKSETKSEGKHKGKSKNHKAHKTKVEKRDSGDSDSDCVGLTVRHALLVCDAGSDKWIIDTRYVTNSPLVAGIDTGVNLHYTDRPILLLQPSNTW